MSAWYIDALDPRAGIAFASERIADLQREEAGLDIPAVQLAPPDFEPEVLTSRSLAFSAAPGQFQLGVFVGEEELGFPSLDALIEFVRRVYLASGGGDTANGIGPAPPPPPEEGPGGGEALAGFEVGEREGGIAAIANAIAKVGAVSKELSGKRAGAQKLDFAIVANNISPGPFDGELLARAFFLLIEGLIDALPRDEKDAAVWLEAASRLGAAFLWLDPFLHKLIGSSAEKALGQKLRHAIKRRAWLSSRINPDEAQWLLRQLFRDWGVGQVIRFSSHGDYVEEWSSTIRTDAGAADPFDDLQSWPLPSRLRSTGLSTLKDHLCAVTGAPLRMESDPQEAAALLLLAAVPIVSHSGSSLLRGHPFDGVLRDDLIRQAARWVLGQFPAYVFTPEIEQIVGEAVYMRSHEPVPELPPTTMMMA